MKRIKIAVLLFAVCCLAFTCVDLVNADECTKEAVCDSAGITNSELCEMAIAACNGSLFENRPSQNKIFGAIEVSTDKIKEYGVDPTVGPIKFVNLLISLVTGIAFVWLLIVIIYNGIKIITGSKSAEVLVASTRSILLSIAGLILVAMAYYITSWVSLRLFGSGDYLTDPLKQVPKATSSPLP